MLTQKELTDLFKSVPQAVNYSTTINATICLEPRAKGPASAQIIGDPIKPVARIEHEDGRSDVLFAFYPRATGRYECVAIQPQDLTQGRATSDLRKAGWWCALPNSADKHLNEMYGDVRDVLPEFRYATHQGLQQAGTFLFNGDVIGPNPNRLVLPKALHVDGLKKAGSLAGWQQSVARYSQYPYIIFALSTALANLPKIALSLPGFCICFVGKTSTGKSSLLSTARSVIGDPLDIENWNASRAGVQDRMLLLSGTPAFFDEKNSDHDMQNDETLAHLISNERTRLLTGRMTSGQRFQALLLATREFKPNDPRLKQPNQGADARWINVPVGETEHGIFYGADDGTDTAKLVDAMIADVRENHGWAYVDFSERLLAAKDWEAMCHDAYVQAESAIAGKDLSDLEKRARKVFSLIGATGYLSAELGATPWDKQDALDAAAITFDFWQRPPLIGAAKKPTSVGTTPAVDPIHRILSSLGAKQAPASRSEELAQAILALLGERQWMSRDERLNIGVCPDPDDEDSDPFFHTPANEKLVCVGQAYLLKRLGENPYRSLQHLKALGCLVVNTGGGLKLSVKVGDDDNRARQFVAVPMRFVPLKVEVEESFNP